MKNNVVYNVLKPAWGSYRTVKMKDLEAGVMTFDFENESDRDRVLDMSPWAIHRHCLNLKLCHPNKCISEVDFGKLQMWLQVHDLSLDMLNTVNAKQVANSIGKCLEMGNEKEMQQRGYIRIKIEVGVDAKLSAGFWWTNKRGKERWTSIKYERLSNFCYECGMLGHTSQACNLDIVPFELNNKLSMYELWLSCARQRKQTGWNQIRGGNKIISQNRDLNRNTWKDMMGEGGAELSDTVGMDRNLKV